MPFNWRAVVLFLPSALPHAVPMVPKVLIGHCKVWERALVLFSIPSAIGGRLLSVNRTLTVCPAPCSGTPTLIGYCTCQRALIGQVSQL